MCNENPQMLATHWTSEGQSKCDEWGSARIHRQGKYVHLVLHLSVSLLKLSLFQTLLQSTTERRQSRTRRIKHDKEWLFRETSPFQMGAKTWNIDWSPSVKKQAGVGAQLQWIVKWTSLFLNVTKVKWGCLTICPWLMQNEKKIKISLRFDPNQVILKSSWLQLGGVAKIGDAIQTGSGKSGADVFAIISELCWRACSYCNSL